MKCHICSAKLEETFLGKIIGSYYKNSKGKRLPVCNACQKKFSKIQISEKLQ